MGNKEQEFVWQKVIEAGMEDVKHHFDDIQQAIEFGCYIQPDNYFVSYIFATDSQLETARQTARHPAKVWAQIKKLDLSYIQFTPCLGDLNSPCLCSP